MPLFISCGFSGKRRFSPVFGLLKMVIFGDEDNMVERFVEIDARVFLEGTAHVASGFCWKTQKTRVFAAISLRSKVPKEALKWQVFVVFGAFRRFLCFDWGTKIPATPNKGCQIYFGFCPSTR